MTIHKTFRGPTGGALDPTAHPVDRHVGTRIRAARREAGVSQTELGERLGITFQQVQKYERAFNRVSASRLYDIAQALGVPVASFYAGLPDQPASQMADAEGARLFAESHEGRAMARAMAALPPDAQVPVTRAMRALASALGRSAQD